MQQEGQLVAKPNTMFLGVSASSGVVTCANLAERMECALAAESEWARHSSRHVEFARVQAHKEFVGVVERGVEGESAVICEQSVQDCLVVSAFCVADQRGSHRQGPIRKEHPRHLLGPHSERPGRSQSHATICVARGAALPAFLMCAHIGKEFTIALRPRTTFRTNEHARNLFIKHAPQRCRR